MNKKTATIKIEPETRDRLKELGKKGETYDEIIMRLILHLKRMRRFDEPED
jgi:hypothetical protein